MGWYYTVAPRYTCGSPAMVDEATALRVAAEEKAAFEHAREGRYGAADQERAKREGLAGIVEYKKELPSGKGWKVHDVCTGEVFERKTLLSPLKR